MRFFVSCIIICSRDWIQARTQEISYDIIIVWDFAICCTKFHVLNTMAEIS